MIVMTTGLYRPQNEVWGKVIFLQLSVILFTGGSAPVHDTPPPGADTIPRDQRQIPSGADTPQEQTPPGAYPPGADTPKNRHPSGADTTPLDQRQTPRSRHHPRSKHPPEADTSLPGADTPRRSACWEVQAISGRYTSYWNAYLFVFRGRTRGH